jgi:hypothetical protein
MFPKYKLLICNCLFVTNTSITVNEPRGSNIILFITYITFLFFRFLAQIGQISAFYKKLLGHDQHNNRSNLIDHTYISSSCQLRELKLSACKSQMRVAEKRWPLVHTFSTCMTQLAEWCQANSPWCRNASIVHYIVNSEWLSSKDIQDIECL